MGYVRWLLRPGGQLFPVPFVPLIDKEDGQPMQPSLYQLRLRPCTFLPVWMHYDAVTATDHYKVPRQPERIGDVDSAEERGVHRGTNHREPQLPNCACHLSSTLDMLLYPVLAPRGAVAAGQVDQLRVDGVLAVKSLVRLPELANPGL